MHNKVAPGLRTRALRRFKEARSSKKQPGTLRCLRVDHVAEILGNFTNLVIHYDRCFKELALRFSTV